MGMYDTFGATQLKVGDCDMAHYDVGDEVTMADGVYVGYEGIVVIKDGVFVAEVGKNELFNKWGGPLEIDLDEANPVAQAIAEYTVPEPEKAPPKNTKVKEGSEGKVWRQM